MHKQYDFFEFEIADIDKIVYQLIRLVRKQATPDKPTDRGFWVEQWFK